MLSVATAATSSSCCVPACRPRARTSLRKRITHALEPTVEWDGRRVAAAREHRVRAGQGRRRRGGASSGGPITPCTTTNAPAARALTTGWALSELSSPSSYPVHTHERPANTDNAGMASRHRDHGLHRVRVVTGWLAAGAAGVVAVCVGVFALPASSQSKSTDTSSTNLRPERRRLQLPVVDEHDDESRRDVLTELVLVEGRATDPGTDQLEAPRHARRPARRDGRRGQSLGSTRSAPPPWSSSPTNDNSAPLVVPWNTRLQRSTRRAAGSGTTRSRAH